MKQGQLVRLSLAVIQGSEAAFLISVAFAAHSFFTSTDGADAPGGTGASILVVPSPLVLMTALTGLVFGCAAIAALLRSRESPILRRTSTVVLTLSAGVNVLVLTVAVLEGVWIVAVMTGLNIALLCAEWRATLTPLDPVADLR